MKYDKQTHFQLRMDFKIFVKRHHEVRISANTRFYKKMNQKLKYYSACFTQTVFPGLLGLQMDKKKKKHSTMDRMAPEEAAFNLPLMILNGIVGNVGHQVICSLNCRIVL